MDIRRNTYISLSIVGCFVVAAFIGAVMMGDTDSDDSSAVVAQTPPAQAVIPATPTAAASSASSDAVPRTPAPSTSSRPSADAASAPAPVADAPKKAAQTYTDGTYTAVGSYDSPAGMESIDVTLTLKGDAVSSATVKPMANDGTSRYFQDRFISGYSAYVVGRKVDSIQLDAVSGSSLTPNGFNSALAKIKAQARA